MSNRRPVYIWISTVLAVLLFLVLTVRIVRNNRFFFTSIDSAVAGGDMIWGINSDRGETTIFRVSAETGIGEFMRVPMIEKERIVTVSDPFISDGRVYFHRTLHSQDGLFSEQLVNWNLEKNRLIEVKNPDTVLKSYSARKKEADSLDSDDGTECELLELETSGKEAEKGHRLLCVRRDGKDKLLTGVQREFGKTLRGILLALLGSVIIFAVLFVLGNIVYYYHVYLSIWFRISLLVLLIVFVLFMLFANYFNRELYTFTIDHVMYHCADFAYIRSFSINQELLAEYVDAEETVTPESKTELWKYDLDEGFLNNDLYNIESNSTGTRINRKAWDMYEDYVIDEESCIIYGKNQEVQILYDNHAGEDPWVTDNSLSSRNHMECAIQEDRIESFVTSSGKQRYAVSFVPYETESGAKILVGTRIALDSSLNRCNNILSASRRVTFLLTLCFLIQLIVCIVYSLWPVRSLKEAIKGVTAGDLTARARCRGNSELAYLAKLFNRMADRLLSQSEGTDSYRYFYEAFIPASLLRRMSDRSVAGALRPKAVYQADAFSLVIDVQGENSSEEEKNSLFETAVRTAEEYDCHPVEFDDKRIKLICTEGSEAALRTVISLQQNLAAQRKPFVWTGLAFCEVRLCVIGTDRRKNVVEQDSYEAEIISEIAAELKIPVILTEALYLDVMHNTAKLHFRCLGRIGKDDYVPDAPLYELLDANTAEYKAVRKYTRTIFEQGVSAYAAGDYFKARNEMIKALELDPEDLAARCYILNCDRKEPPLVCQAIKQSI